MLDLGVYEALPTAPAPVACYVKALLEYHSAQFWDCHVALLMPASPTENTDLPGSPRTGGNPMRELEQQLKTFSLREFTEVQTSKPVKSGSDFGEKDILILLPKSALVFTTAILVKCFSLRLRVELLIFKIQV